MCYILLNGTRCLVFVGLPMILCDRCGCLCVGPEDMESHAFDSVLSPHNHQEEEEEEEEELEEEDEKVCNRRLKLSRPPR